nr:hypothetical protein [Tanacetum cinerariifolium]
PNGKMIVDSIENGPYVRRMIATPGEPDLPVSVPKTFYEQTNEELTENVIKQMDGDNQAIQTILLGFLKMFRQTKNLHEADFTQIDDFLKINQDENGGNQNTLVVVPGIANQNETGNIVAARSEGTGNRNQVRCYNCRGLGHIARNYTVRPKRRDVAYLQTQLLIAQKEEAGIQLQAEEFEFMATAGDLDEIEEVNANCILMANLQQASTSGVFVPQTTKSIEKLFLSYVSNTVTLPKMISIPNEDLSNDTTPSVARKGSQIISHEIAPIINQVDARVQNFEIQFLKEAAKFVWDIKSLAKEADESLDKQKSLELEIKRLLKASVSHDVMSIVQNRFIDVSSNLQTNLDRTNAKLKNCIIKKENEYAKLRNDWYRKCKKCKYDKISYDKAYKDVQCQIKRLQAQLGDLKGKSSITLSASNTLDPLNQKLEKKIMELEFQVVNYERKIRHLKTTYKNLFDSITSNRAHAKLHNLIYENAKLRAQLFENTSESMNNTSGTSVTPQVDKPKLI